AIAYEDLSELDRYILHQTSNVFNEVTEAFESFQFFKFFQKVQNFCVVDLSNFYLDAAKDRLYISDANSPRRRSCQTVIALILETLTKAIAPVLCHMAEDIWQNLPYETGHKSVFNAGWFKLDEKWAGDKALFQKWEQLREIRNGVNQVLEKARTEKMIGASLEAKILMRDVDGKLTDWLTPLNPSESLNDGNNIDELRYLLLVSQVEFVTDSLDAEQYQDTIELADGNLQVAVKKADGEKCDRCWNYSLSVASFADDPTICDRCNKALIGKF
ncbi:MAG: class I tRNA ligase family protein, partial [Limnothrix sp.]